MVLPIFARYFRMKNTIILTFLLGISQMLTAQVFELGFVGGATNYVGDIGRTNYIYPTDLGAGITFKYNWNPRIAVRASYNYLPISGDDENAETDFMQARGRNFTNTIHELAFGVEYNFYEYNIAERELSWTPYILLEVAAFNYTTAVNEITPGNYQTKLKTSISIPVGIGIKSQLAGPLAIALETKFAVTFEDDIDFSTPNIPSLDYGGTGNDWYMFTGISFIYTFGRPPCYTSGL